MHFLLTNDDGIDAQGLKVLEKAVGGLGTISVVAPNSEQSGAGHSLTLHHPLRAYERDPRHLAVSGTPTDSVLLAVEKLLPQRPDWVISGINHGSNMGEDVTYSGTVAAAMEAVILGIPALAISLAGRRSFNWDTVAEILPALIENLLNYPLGTNQLLNINIPNLPAAEIRGTRATRLGSRQYTDSVVPQKDPRGRDYYWIGGTGPEWAPDEASDAAALQAGYISITPILIDMTDHDALPKLESFIKNDCHS